ncbi:MAG: thioredoxin reductase [Bradymonadia bacterium]|jgi:thioredoxin reductase
MSSVLIVGAGPIGLDCAAHAVAARHEVTIVESGLDVGEAVRSWGHVTLFSPWELNTSAAGRALLEPTGWLAPDPSTFPTGEELYTSYLEPLRDVLNDRVSFRYGTDVVAVGRGRLLKNSHIGDDVRRECPFRILTDSDAGEDLFGADYVIDASGVLDCPNFLGTGGIPAIGEADAYEYIVRYVPNFATERKHFTGKKVLLVGGGSSAATTLKGLEEMAQAGDVEALWVTAVEGEPFTRIENDSLPQRDALAVLGNRIAAGNSPIEHRSGLTVRRLAVRNDERVLVEFEDAHGNLTTQIVDLIISNVGYRPNNALFEELQVHQCYASQGPMKLAASLMAAGGGGDCLAQEAPGPDLLRNPEPRFFVLGAKSYGRNSAFLLRLGYQQAEQVMAMIE